jgi:hypothetical protein
LFGLEQQGYLRLSAGFIRLLKGICPTLTVDNATYRWAVPPVVSRRRTAVGRAVNCKAPKSLGASSNKSVPVSLLIALARTEKAANLKLEAPPKAERDIERIEHSLPYRLVTSPVAGVEAGK